jgi:hypothetical protein
MEIVSALALIGPVLMQIEGGAKVFLSVLATLHAGGKLSDEQVQQIRDDKAIADAEYDAELEAAKARIANG